VLVFLKQQACNKRSVLFSSFLFCLFFSYAQDKSNKGKEFWLGYGHNVLFTADNPINAQQLVLYLSAEQAATVTVTVNGTAFSQTVSIPANTVDYSIVIPKSGINDARIVAEGLSTKGIHIVSNTPIVAYAHEYGLESSGATMLMPVETYGYTYYSVNYTQSSNYINSFSWFYVVASENNTRLVITPSDTTQGGWLPNHSYTVNLNKGEIYNVFGKTDPNNYDGKDMTGSKVVSVSGADGSCHPVALFSGSSRNDLLSPNCSYTYTSGTSTYTVSGNGGEFMMQQIFPANTWGTKYVTYHTINNTSGNVATPFYTIYRVAVRNPATVVKRNGVVMTGLINNFYYEFTSSTGDLIEADQPILVAQYTTSTNQCLGATNNPLGDPEMIYLSPIEQGVKKAIFYNTGNQSISLAYVNIIVPTGGLSSLLIDGVPLASTEYITHPTDNQYAFAARRLFSVAQHSITCDSSFVATVYGTGTYESYGYNVGTLVNNLNAISSIKNTYNTNGIPDTFTCPKTPVRLYIQLAYRATSISWGLSQAGGGLFPNTDSVITNPLPIDSNRVDGRKYYTYTLQQDFTFTTPGTYYIPVVYTAPDIDNCNQTEHTTATVVVKPGPVADFVFPNPACLQSNVNFTGNSSANGFTLASYAWLFDDHTSANTLNAVKQFATAGNHAVEYTIIAGNGCVGDTTKTITISQSIVPVITVTGKPCVDSVFSFTSSIAYSANNTGNWYWDFGDGQTQNVTTASTTTHAYASATSNITVKHAVTINQGCQTDTGTVVIPVIHANPVAAFSITGDTLCTGKPILFSAIADPTIATWQWSFGDGSSSNNPPPLQKSYAKAGSYQPGLVVTTTAGCGSLPATHTVAIAAPPVIDAGPDQFVNLGSSVVLNATAFDTQGCSFLWTPGIYLNANNILNPISTPQASVLYTLTAYDNVSHCMATDSAMVTVVTRIVVPNVFSPNGDGINDTWQIPTLLPYTAASVEVYNRGGQLVYRSPRGYTQPWDGTINGKPVPIGTYYYLINPHTGDPVLSGAVTILR